MAWVAVAGAAITVGGQIYGQTQAKKAQRKADAFLQQRRNDIASKLSVSQNQSYLDTDAARGALEQVRKNMQEVSKATANSAVQGGSTPEAVIATQGKLQDKYQDAVTGLLNTGENMKQRDKYLYEGMGMNLDNQQGANLAGKVAQWGQFGQNVSAAGAGLMSAWANGAFDKKAGQSSSGMIGELDSTRLGEAESEPIYTG